MFYRYRFEAQFYPGLTRIPLHVRMKLDLTGVRISLKDWLAFSLEERQVLCHLPVDSEEEKKTFLNYTDFLSRRYLGERAPLVSPITDPPWESLDEVPEPVRAKSEGRGQPVAVEEWRRWDLGQRYALFKLSISKNEPEQFYRALQEFRSANSPGAHAGKP